jgi:hypothetical protein
MEKNKDLIRCTNCWEGFDWEEIPPGDVAGKCPRGGTKGKVTQGGFLVCGASQRRFGRSHPAIDFTAIAARPNFVRVNGAGSNAQTVRPERR